MTPYRKPFARVFSLVTMVLVAALQASAAVTTQKTFARPDEAVRALVAAGRANDEAQLVAILGTGSEDIVSSGDPVADRNERARVAAASRQRMRFETLPSGAVIAHLGTDDWPLPIPLVQEGKQWRFDAVAAREELLNRRIGRNELKAADVARVYVEAQREHARRERAYAQKLRSDPGQHDGLYWDDPTGTHPSPLGPLLAEAATEGYLKTDPASGPEPYHGYFFRILKEQGPGGPGGARNYVKDGKMTGGFALVAYPAEYGSSGVMTFIVGAQGVVYQKNLGPKTEDIGAVMTAFDPDESWMPVRD